MYSKPDPVTHTHNYNTIEFKITLNYIYSEFKASLSYLERKKKNHSQVVVVHAFNLSTLEAEAGGSTEFKASLVYRTSSKIAWATQRNPLLKTKNKKQKTDGGGEGGERRGGRGT